MVCLIWSCVCQTCQGHSAPDPRSLKGEMVFGGWKCMCGCHSRTGRDREEFIAMKEKHEKNDKNTDIPKHNLPKRLGER